MTYWADWKTGFHADVKYEGQATYPQTKPQYGPPSPPGNYSDFISCFDVKKNCFLKEMEVATTTNLQVINMELLLID